MNLYVLSFDWWWSAVALPVFAGAGWLLKFWFDRSISSKQEKSTVLSEELDRLTSATSTLQVELDKVAPTIANLRRELAESVSREIDLWEKLRRMSAQSAHQAQQIEQLKAALRLNAARITQLRDLIAEHTHIVLPPEADTIGMIESFKPNDLFNIKENES